MVLDADNPNVLTEKQRRSDLLTQDPFNISRRANFYRDVPLGQGPLIGAEFTVRVAKSRIPHIGAREELLHLVQDIRHLRDYIGEDITSLRSQKIEAINLFGAYEEHIEHVERFLTLVFTNAFIELGDNTVFEVPEELEPIVDPNKMQQSTLNYRFLSPLKIPDDVLRTTGSNLFHDTIYGEPIDTNHIIAKMIATRYGYGFIPSENPEEEPQGNILDLMKALSPEDDASVRNIIDRAKTYIKYIKANNPEILDKLKWVENPAGNLDYLRKALLKTNGLNKYEASGLDLYALLLEKNEAEPLILTYVHLRELISKLPPRKGFRIPADVRNDI